MLTIFYARHHEFLVAQFNGESIVLSGLSLMLTSIVYMDKIVKVMTGVIWGRTICTS